MLLFLGILAVILFILLFAEKNDKKRKHLTLGFISVAALMTLLSIVKTITLIL